MASIVQHHQAGDATAALTTHQPITMPKKPHHIHRPRPADLERVENIVTTITQLGAATINDVAKSMHLTREAIRRHFTALVASGRLVILAPSSHAVGALYGPPEMDDACEFDQYRKRTSTWPRGQHHRDPLVAALFGDAQAEGAA